MSLQFSEYGLLLPRDEPYPMTMDQVRVHFGERNHVRRNVFDGLERGVKNLMAAGVTRIVLGGSFISLKENPSDADIAWWYNPAIDWQRLDPAFQSENRREALGKYLLDQKVDGTQDVGYKSSHEHFLRTNIRAPFGHQQVGIVQLVTEVKIDYIRPAEK